MKTSFQDWEEEFYDEEIFHKIPRKQKTIKKNKDIVRTQRKNKKLQQEQKQYYDD